MNKVLMKKKFLLAIMALTAAVFSPAQELILNCESRGQVRSVFPRYAGHVTLQIGEGRTGNAFRIVCPQNPSGKKHSGAAGRFQADGKSMIRIVSVSSPLHTGVWLKGRGKGRFGLLAYDKDRKVFYPPALMKSFTVDSPDQWKLVELSYTPEAGSIYANKTAYILPYISLDPGSEFLLDDWETKFITPAVKIVIEE